MATPNQYSVTHKELVELIVKHSNIHEGKWFLALSLGFGPGNFGPSDDQMSPGVVVAVNQIIIQREQPGQPAPEALVVDAAIVNPLVTSPSTKKRG